jgi:crotonobetainyl-CoA:carnitine CoA-transferase CaiB-like acyl-CoA transferase
MGQSSTIPSESLPRKLGNSGLRLLAGIRVVDLTTSIAGPYATMLLGDLGAETIKIERPKVGDDSRHWTPPAYAGHALWYLSVNRNKKSVTLDYGPAQGRELLHGLIAKSDVVVTNQLARVQKKLGIDWETVRRIKPDIIFVSITGFGLSGARSQYPCYDLIAEGYSGVMDLTGEPDDGPQKVGTPAADLLAGADAAMGCVAALVDRRTTGKGHLVEVSLVESMTRFMTPRIVSYLGSGEVPRRSGARDSMIVVYQVFQTADEPITLGLPNDNIWARFCAAIGQPTLADDPRFKDNAARVSVRAELVALIQAVLREKPRAYWLDLFAREQIPAGPINSIDQVTANAELLERGLFYSIAADGHAIPQVGLGIRFDDQAAGHHGAPPALSEHTNAILTNLLGLTPADLTDLRARGAL